MPTLAERCREDPLAFGRLILGRKRWEGQRAIRRALETHRKIRVQSGNGTGKTHEIAAFIIEYLARGDRRRAVISGPSYSQVRHGIWAEVVAAWHDAKKRGLDIGREPGVDEWTIGPGRGAFIASVENVASIQGGRGQGGTLVVVDEAHGVENAELWTALETIVQSESSRFITASNPLYPEGVDYEHSLSTEWHTVVLDAFRHPNVVTGREVIPGAVPKRWVDEKIAQWGADDPRTIARVFGRYPDKNSTSLFTDQLIARAAAIVPTRKDGRHVGIDIADEGDDSNVAYLVEDGVVTKCREWSGIDTMGTAGTIVQLIREWKVDPENVHIDATGVGSGVRARLHEQRLFVDGVNFAEAQTGAWDDVIGDQLCLNVRVEMYLVAAQLIRTGQLCIPDEFRTARLDLCATRMVKPHSSGAAQLEQKDAIKKRIGRSPDHGDAVVLAFHRQGGGWFR